MSDCEPLAVFDQSGRRIGVKSRAAVHADGDWHWLVFVWAAQPEPTGMIRLLLQVRGRPGDPYLGSLDAPAGGHVAAFETHCQAAQREFREEVGIELAAGDLVYLGERYLENPTGHCQRVIEHFYLCQRSIDLREVEFSEEVSGFVEVGLEDFVALLEGHQERIPGRSRFASRPEEIRQVDITPQALAAYSGAILESFQHSMQKIRVHLAERPGHTRDSHHG